MQLFVVSVDYLQLPPHRKTGDTGAKLLAMSSVQMLVTVAVVCAGLPANTELMEDEDAGRAWLEDYNIRAQRAYTASVRAYWAYNTNLTDYNLQQQVRVI